MKNSISAFILMVGLLLAMALGNQLMAGHPELVPGPPQIASTDLILDAGDVQIAFEQTNIGNKVSGNFFSENWGTMVIGLLGFFDLLARLTPTTRDNSIVNFLSAVINAIIPNFKKGGGVFTST